MSTILPVATGSQVRRYAMRILRTYPRPVYLALALHGFAALAALAGPRLLGDSSRRSSREPRWHT